MGTTSIQAARGGPRGPRKCSAWVRVVLLGVCSLTALSGWPVVARLVVVLVSARGSLRWRVSRLGLAFVTLMLVGLGGAAGALASAGAPIMIATNGMDPQVAVDSQGTAHIVWEEEGSAPDSGITEYCQIPAGGTACTDDQSFPTPWGGGARVLLGSTPGEVVLLQGGLNGQVYVWVSMDGGQSFSSGPNGSAGVVAAQIPQGNLWSEEQPAFGPGGFSASLMNVGGYFESFPLNVGPPVNTYLPTPGTTQDTQLFTDCGLSFDHESPDSIALLNDSIPVAECENVGTGTIYYRVATGQGNLNDVTTGSWGPVQQVAAQNHGGDVGAWIAGGSRGVYLLYNAPDGSAEVSQLINGTFGPPTVIAANTYVEGFSEDPTGNLYAVTQDDSYPAAGKDQRVFTSADGVDWTEVPLNLAGVNALPGDAEYAEISGCAAAAGGDETGSGFIVGEPEADGYGALYAESFGNSPCGASPGAGNCPTHLVVGAAQLTATSGCFKKGSNGTYTTSDQFELNGLMITPGAGGQVILDTVNNTISTGGSSAVVKASYVVLDTKPFDWLVPSGTSVTMSDLLNHGNPVAFSPSANGSRLAGFVINGLVTPVLKSGGMASLPVNVQMPSPLGAIIGSAPTDDVTLTTGNSIPGGLDLSPGSIDIKLPAVWLGIAELSPFEINYDSDPNVFDGHINIILPVIGSALNTHFQFENGSFVEGDVTANLGMTVPVDADVFLTQVGVQVYGQHGGCPALDWSPDNPGPAGSASPTYIGGSLNVGLGPLGPDGHTGLFNVIGTVSYTFPQGQCDEPGVFSINGQGELFGFKVARAFITYKTDGDLSLGAALDIGPSFANIQGSVGGELAVDPTRFDLYGSVAVNVIGISLANVQVIASSVGIGGCFTVFGFGGQIGYVWGGSVSGHLISPFSTPCDLSSFVPAGLSLPPGSSRDGHAASASSVKLKVPAHLVAEEIGLTGTGGAPLVRLTGPGGQQITTPAVAPGEPFAETQTRVGDVLVAPEDHEMGANTGATAVKLLHPQPGNWTITPLAGSPAIANIDIAHGLPPVSVTASVSNGSGRKRTLVYANTPAQGRKVTFIEKDSDGTLHTIATITAAHGRIRFLPGSGPAGSRTILAEVTERGIAEDQLAVATYTAPGPPTLAKPKSVTVTRIGSKIRISWGAVNGAARYVVRAMLADGRSLLMLEAPSVRSVIVTAVPGFDAGSVMVAALNATNQPGPIGTVTLKALKATCQRPKAARGKLVCSGKKPKNTSLATGLRLRVQDAEFHWVELPAGHRRIDHRSLNPVQALRIDG